MKFHLSPIGCGTAIIRSFQNIIEKLTSLEHGYCNEVRYKNIFKKKFTCIVSQSVRQPILTQHGIYKSK